MSLEIDDEEDNINDDDDDMAYDFNHPAEVSLCASLIVNYLLNLLISFLVSNYQSYLDMSKYKGNRLKDTIMRFWIKRHKRLVTDYSLVGYMLSPNPKIMAHCAGNKSSLHVDTVDCFIEKLILDQMMVGTKCREKLADLIDKFKDEYGEFMSQRGRFCKDNIWMVAAKQDTEGFRWHTKYSIETTEVLRMLACLVLSKKILGIGTAERNWKQVKKAKKGDCTKTGIDKTTKQVLIFFAASNDVWCIATDCSLHGR